MTTYDPEDQGRAPSCRRAAAGILADLAMRVRGPKFVNVDRAQLNSQNFLRFLNQSWRTPSAMIGGNGCNGGVDVSRAGDNVRFAPQKRTWISTVVMSALCQKQNIRPTEFDHLVSRT